MPSFQFHKGAIRTSYATSAGSANSDFNSIKVRLELEYSRLPLDRFNGFQFHKGAIRTSSSVFAFSDAMEISIP